MISAWTKACKTEEEKERLTNTILGSTVALDRLKELMKEDEEQCVSAELSSKSYDSPNWELRQADSHGYRRCLRYYQKLLNLDQGN